MKEGGGEDKKETRSHNRQHAAGEIWGNRVGRTWTHLSSAVFASWMRLFVQSPVARRGVVAAGEEDEGWADDELAAAELDAISIC